MSREGLLWWAVVCDWFAVVGQGSGGGLGGGGMEKRMIGNGGNGNREGGGGDGEIEGGVAEGVTKELEGLNGPIIRKS